MKGVFELWKSGNRGYGCPNLYCTRSLYGMFLKTRGGFDWRADLKKQKKAFICAARCPAQYR